MCELNLCPFCGSKNVKNLSFFDRDGDEKCFIACFNCGVAFSKLVVHTEPEYAVVGFDSKQEAAAAWNDRVVFVRMKDEPVHPVQPKEYVRYGMGWEYYDYFCPTCDSFVATEPIGNAKSGTTRCPTCGQLLIWDKEDSQCQQK